MSFSVAAGMNVMSATGRKRRPSDESDDDDVIDDTVAAMILMSLSCSPKSPRLTEAMIYGEHRLSSAYERTSECNCDSSSPCSHSNSSHSNSSHSPHSSHSPVSQSPSQFNDGSTMSGSQSPILSPISLAFFPSSAPTWSHLEDHEYLASSHSHTHYTQSEDAEMLTAKAGNGLQTRSKHKSNPINIPGISFAHPYANSAPTVALQSPRANNKYMRLNSNNNNRFGGTTLLQSPNKNSPNNKRGRGESRKCRKVYGMDNRDMWCTQCKWKKACSRFTG